MPTETTETYNIFAVGSGGVDPSNLTFQDIVNALGYTPYSNQNPNGYVTNSDVTTSILSYNYVTQTELENALANYQPSGTYVKGIKLNNVQQTVDSTGNVSLTIDHTWGNITGNISDNSALSSALSAKSTVVGTASNNKWTALTIDGVNHTIGGGVTSYNDLTDKPTIPSSSNFVTLDTIQNITGNKSFLNGISIYTSTNVLNGISLYTATKETNYNINGISAGRNMISFPTKSGTIALTNDLYNLVSYKNRDRYGRVVDLYYDSGIPSANYGLKIENSNDDYVEIGANKIKWYDDDDDAPGTGIYDISFPQKTGTMALTSDIPTNISSFTNDSGFITNTYHDSTKQDVLTAGTGVSINNNVISVDLSAYETEAHASATYQTIDTAYNRSNIVYSSTEPSNPTIGMIWLQPVS